MEKAREREKEREEQRDGTNLYIDVPVYARRQPQYAQESKRERGRKRNRKGTRFVKRGKDSQGEREKENEERGTVLCFCDRDRESTR